MSLRLRLTLVCVLLAGPALAGFAIVVFLLGRSSVYGEVDSELESRRQAIEAALLNNVGPITQEDIAVNRQVFDRLAVSGNTFAVLDPAGTIVYTSDPGAVQVVDGPKVEEEAHFGTASVEGEDLRILSFPVVRFGQTIALVETQTSLEAAQATMSDIRKVLVVGTIVTLALIAFPAYFLTGRALEHVADAAHLADRIESTADFSQRLPEGKGPRETQELSGTFNRMIERVQRMMEGQRAFLAESSHELRRPLTILRTNIDVMNDPRLSAEERQTIETEMRSEAQAMSRLITDLLLLSRDDETPNQFADVNLSAICEQAFQEVTTMAGRSLNLKPDIQPHIFVRGDSNRLRQSVENLIENACGYTPSGGEVGLQLESDGLEILLTVHDSGVGIPPEDQERIFDRFFRGTAASSRRPEGFGLGLAIVKHVTEAHGGSVSVTSVPGAGSSFTLRLPAS